MAGKGTLNLLWGGIKASLRQPWLAWRRRRGLLVKPLFLDYAVTWRCNARCQMCNTWRRPAEHPQTGESELSPGELDAILARDADFLGAVEKVGLTGGEPFLRPDLVELVRVLHRRLPQVRISLVSNGLLTERILTALEEIRSFFPDLVFSVSLDGLGELHDQVRGVPGAFQRALATMRGALELGFTVTSGLTITPHNYHQIGPVAEMLAQMGVDFSCNLQEQGANFNNQGRAVGLDARQRAEVLRQLEPFAHHYYMDNLRQQLLGRPRTLPCYAGFTSYFLTPFGEVCVCNLIGTSLGSLRKKPFARIAHHPRSWRLRRELADCTCWSQCEVKKSAAVAPWSVLAWLARNPRKGEFLRHYTTKSGLWARGR